MSGRLFRLADAQALLPRLAEIFTRIRSELEGAQDLARVLGESGYQVRADGSAVLDLTAPAEVQHKQRLLIEITQRIAERLDEVHALGAEVKAVDGLVDFRSRFEGRVVYLCWRFGEERIQFWHDLEAGFAGRQRILDPESFEGDYLQ